MNNRIREKREALKMTQAQLSEISGVARTIISQLENGTRKTVTSETMLKLSKALNSPINEIFLM